MNDPPILVLRRLDKTQGPPSYRGQWKTLTHARLDCLLSEHTVCGASAHELMPSVFLHCPFTSSRSLFITHLQGSPLLITQSETPFRPLVCSS